jgi:hypothetical protein
MEIIWLMIVLIFLGQPSVEHLLSKKQPVMQKESRAFSKETVFFSHVVNVGR